MGISSTYSQENKQNSSSKRGQEYADSRDDLLGLSLRNSERGIALRNEGLTQETFPKRRDSYSTFDSL